MQESPSKFKEAQVRQLLHKMVTDLLIFKPSDPVPAMLQILVEAKGVSEEPITLEEREELR